MRAHSSPASARSSCRRRVTTCVASFLTASSIGVSSAGVPNGSLDFSREQLGGDRAFALLANGRLIRIDLATARVLRSRVVSPRPARIVEGRSLALNRSRTRLYVLAGRVDGPQEIVTVEAATLIVRRRSPLPDDLVFRSILVGPQSGNLYLFANTLPTDAGSAAVVVVVRAADGLIRTRQELRPADGRNWFVFDAAIDRDERRTYVSYHGGCIPATLPRCTTGADAFYVGASFSRCSSEPTQNAGCLTRAHGQIHEYGDGAIAASGGPLIQFDGDGREVRRLETRLPRNHTMTFTITANRRAAVSINPCPSSGLSVIDLNSGRAAVRARPICGTKVAAAKSGRLLVAKSSFTVPQWTPGQLLIDDPKRMHVQVISTASEATDVLAG